MSSDWHVGHAAILKYCADTRPFSSVDEMNEALVTRINETVGPRDQIWFLGDFVGKPFDGMKDWFDRIHGEKHLVFGNHDDAEVKSWEWASVQETKYFRWMKRRIFMFHYPMLTWGQAHRGVWHLHGHCHGNLTAPESTRMDVGIDTHPEFRPYAFDEIVEIMSTKTYDYVDHHQPRD